MTQEPVDLTTPQPPVTSEPRGTREPPRMSFPQLLERLATAASERVAAERAAATQDVDEQQKLERVARLARELAEALSDVEPTRARDPRLG